MNCFLKENEIGREKSSHLLIPVDYINKSNLFLKQFHMIKRKKLLMSYINLCLQKELIPRFKNLNEIII